MQSFQGSVAVIKVGAATEIEMKKETSYRRGLLLLLRLLLKRVSLRGGTAYINAVPAVALLASLEGDEKTGARSFLKFLKLLSVRLLKMQDLRAALLSIR